MYIMQVCKHNVQALNYSKFKLITIWAIPFILSHGWFDDG